MPKALKYLFSMKRLPLLLLMLAGGIFLTMKTMGSDKTPPRQNMNAFCKASMLF